MAEEHTTTRSGGRIGLLRMSAVAAVAGLGIGLVGGCFRWLLRHAEVVRVDLIDSAHSLPGPSWLVPVAVVAAGSALARLIVRYVPLATGSGIQDVEADWRREVPPAPLVLLPAKFVGGLLAIGSGLALGREGPTVHMGAVIGSEAGRRARLSREDVRVLQVAIGGAGLAVAFNAPFGGGLFVFEEVTKAFRFRLVLVTAIGCATSIVSSRLILGDASIFRVAHQSPDLGWSLVLFVGFGLLTGLLGALYNVLIMGALHLSDRLSGIGPEAQAAIIGAVVGLFLFVEPFVVGGGDRLTQRLVGGGVALASLAGYGVARFLIGPFSYASGAPGGLFAPLLAVGAVWGALFHGVAHGVLPGMGDSAVPYAVVGMAALFAAVVRAPFTGIVLILEMTATSWLLAPLLLGSLAAVLAARMIHSAPIYDSLGERMLAHPEGPRTGPHVDPDP